MKAEDLIQIIDISISNEKADAVIDKVKVENYHLGKLDGYTKLREQIINAIYEEVNASKPTESSEKPQAEAKKVEQGVKTTKKK